MQGGWAGSCNIDLDPQFYDATAGDLRLLPPSSAINVGNSNVVLPDFTDVNDSGTLEPKIPWDIDRKTRILPPLTPSACRVDMGAYEDQCILRADFDGSRIVDLQDLANFLACYGMPATCSDSCFRKDIDCSGIVDLQDLAYVLSDYGLSCPIGLQGGLEEGNSMMSGPPDPLTEWLRSASPEEVLDWWFAGQPPIGGDER